MTFDSGSPAAYRCSWSRTRRWARGHIALLAPPTCGRDQQVGARSRAGCRRAAARGRRRRRPRVIRPAASAATRSSVTTTAPRATLTSSAPSFIRARKSGVDQAAGGVGERHDEDHHVGVGQQRRAARRSAWTPSRARAGDPDDLDLERQQPGLDGRADRAVPDEQHPLVGQRRAPARTPTRAGPGPHELRDAAQRRQDQGERELGGRRVVDAAAVAEGDARRAPGRGCCRRRR